MKRTKSQTPSLGDRATETVARVPASATEADFQRNTRSTVVVARSLDQRSSASAQISAEPTRNLPVGKRTAAERFVGWPPTPPHYAHIQWTSARAARTLAQWRGLLRWDSAEKYPHKSVLFSQGDEAKSAFLLARGVVKLAYSSPDGGQHLLGLRYPGDLIGDWWLDLKMHCPLSAITAVPCEIHRVDSTQIRERAVQDRNAQHFHTETLQRDLCRLAATHLALKGLPPTDILERLLWELASVLAGFAPQGVARLVLPFSNAEMADLCGLSESHYKEVRRELELTGRVRHLARRLWVLHRGEDMSSAG
jgi:CRP/FNR family transcriptional regulator